MVLVCVREVHTALLSDDAQLCPQAPPLLQVRAELSDGRVEVLKRTDEDLAWMMKKLVDTFPDDRDTLSNQLLSRLLRVRAAEQSPEQEFKVQEINKLLTAIIHLPLKFSQSEPVRMFFGLDQDMSSDFDLKPELSEDSNQTDQTEEPTTDSPDTTGTPEEPSAQSPEQGPGPGPVVRSVVSVKDVLRCNGFCLANTETILYDQSEDVRERMNQSQSGSLRNDADRRASINTSCLGHAPGRGLSHLFGCVVRGRSLKMKKVNSGVEDAKMDAVRRWKYDTR